MINSLLTGILRARCEIAGDGYTGTGKMSSGFDCYEVVCFAYGLQVLRWGDCCMREKAVKFKKTRSRCYLLLKVFVLSSDEYHNVDDYVVMEPPGRPPQLVDRFSRS